MIQEHDIAWVASFCADDAKQVEGNRHIIVNVSALNGRSSVVDLGLSLTSKIPHFIIAFLHLPTSIRQPAHACFFQNGNVIKRCGSGSIATACYLDHRMIDKSLYHHQLLKHNEGSVGEDSYATASNESTRNILFPLQLINPAVKDRTSTITVGKKQGEYYYVSTVLPLLQSARPELQRKLINQPVKEMFLLGGKQDYCLLVLPNKSALVRCELNVRLYHQLSKRSLIVTAPANEPGCDYFVRYFNPRYGAYEDAATGSANAMLADYWQTKLKRKTVRGLQLSQQGGKFTVTRREGLVLEQEVQGAARFMLPEDIGLQQYRHVNDTIHQHFANS